MAGTVIRDQQVWVGALKLDGQLNMIDLDMSREALDDARLGDNTAVMIAGRLTTTLGLGGFWDPTVATAIEGSLFSDVGAIRPYIIDVTGAGEGGLAYLGNAVLTGRPITGQHGQNSGMTIAGATRDTPPIRGILVRHAVGISAGGDGDEYEYIAVPAGKKLWAALSVYAGTSIDIDVTVESDVDADFDGSETEQIDFGNITGIGSQLLTKDGAITDTFYRVVIAVNGGTGISLAVAIGVW